MRKTIVYLTAAFIVFTTVLSAQPQKQCNNLCNESGPCKELKLTHDQEKQFKDIRYERRKKAIDMHSQIQKNRLEIKHMVVNNNIDEKRLLSIIDENSKIQGELKNSEVKSWLSIRKILTPEQQEIWSKHFDGEGRHVGEGFGEKLKNKIEERKHMRMEKRDDKKTAE